VQKDKLYSKHLKSCIVNNYFKKFISHKDNSLIKCPSTVLYAQYVQANTVV